MSQWLVHRRFLGPQHSDTQLRIGSAMVQLIHPLHGSWKFDLHHFAPKVEIGTEEGKRQGIGQPGVIFSHHLTNLRRFGLQHISQLQVL